MSLSHINLLDSSYINSNSFLIHLSYMSKRPKTPEQLASDGHEKGPYTLYLRKDNVEFLRLESVKNKTSLSVLVDEAIDWYIKTITKKKD